MTNFIVQFPLNTQPFQEDILEKRFEIGRQIYNSLVNITQNRYKEMIKTKLYRSIKAELSELYMSINKQNIKRKNELFAMLNDLYKEYGLSEYSFHSDVSVIQHHFKKNIDSHTAQKIATNLWKSYQNLLFGNGDYVHYKKRDSFYSLEGKTNASGIRLKGTILFWLGLQIPVKINFSNPYEHEAMQNKISYCRIVRKYVRSKYKYYLQIVFRGIPPIKLDKETGSAKHTIGDGDVGLDIGTQTIAICSDKSVKLYEIADRVESIEREKRIMLRKLDRSKRAMNPENFNEDGTIKKQGSKKVKWIKSKQYIKNQNKLKEIQRKQADIRKLQHEILANEIISLGHNIYVETMNFKGLQARAKKTEKNEKGKFKRKARFGKSLANKAPSMLLSIIERKLRYHNKQLIKIDTYSVKASQYNHIEEKYVKKKLSNRWNDLQGVKIQRDIYSAFLIMNVSEDLKGINQEKCTQRFNLFVNLHNKEVERLTGFKNLSSIAI